MFELEDSLNAIQSSNDVDSLRTVSERMFMDLGYAAFSYTDIRRLPLSGEPVPFYCSTARPDFLETYIAEDFLGYDPIVQRAATTNAPFTWAAAPEFHTWRKRRGARNRARYVMEVANEFGYTQGYVLPSHAVDPKGRPASALVTLYWADRPEQLVPVKSMPPWLRLVVSSMHEKMLELRGLSGENAAPPLLLTDRERECMVWACRGKTRSETADILGISDRTVEFHFQNAMRKLRVHNKFHAIAIAIHMGLIVP